MTLPEIPAVAFAAGATAAHRAQGVDPLPGVLEAVWPHLYAAALRHVVADLEERHCSFAGLTYLREMADEATT